MLLICSIVSVAMVMDVFAKYLEDLETVERREISSDRQMNSGSYRVEKSEVNMLHTEGSGETHTYTLLTHGF